MLVKPRGKIAQRKPVIVNTLIFDNAGAKCYLAKGTL